VLIGRLAISANTSKIFDIQDLLLEFDGLGTWIELIATSWQLCTPQISRCGIYYTGAGTKYYGVGGTTETELFLDNCALINIPREVINNDYVTLNHCTFIDCCSLGGTLVATAKTPVINNSLSINCGADGGSATGDYNASDSDPLNVPGGNSIAATTADLVDYAGGDYRTKLSSSLATAGSGGTFIGAFLEESGGGTTVEIPTLDNAATTYAPTISVTNHQTVEIPTSTHAITTYAPTITIGNNIDIEIPTLDNSATTYAPVITVSDHQTVEIPTLDNSATTYAPTITTTSNVTVTIPTSTHSITTYAPDISVTNHITIEIPLSLHQITTYAPQIQIGGTPEISTNLESLITVTDNCLMPITPIQTLTAPIQDDETTVTCLIREQEPLPTCISSAELTNYANIEPEINLVATMRG
jgi:hypothetical protein